MKQILIPTDFSDNAWKATVYALKLFANQKCVFYLLHSAPIKSSRISSFSNKLSRVMQENAVKDLKHLQERIEKTYANANHNFKVLTSSHGIEQAVSIAVGNHDIDLVVMGTKGATGAKEMFLGSNTIEIIGGTSKCPVLAIPDTTEYKELKNIGFSSDLNRLYSDVELEPIKELASIHGSILNIFHIKTEKDLSNLQQENLDALQMFIENVESKYHEFPHYTNKTNEIIDFINEKNIDVLAMIKYKHSFFENLFREPVIKNLGHQLAIPLLVIPAKNT